jgi:hypothetical protein
MMRRGIIQVLFLVLAACPTDAREFSLMGGPLKDIDSQERSYSWQLEYAEEIHRHFKFSFSYLNEGHVPGHHRDGNAFQLWGRTDILDYRLSLSAGIGPYFYYDTTMAGSGGSYSDTHGWGSLASIGVTSYTCRPWLLQLRANWVNTSSDISTLSVLFGIGYEFTEDAPTETPPGKQTRNDRTDNEITVFAGRTIVNSFESENMYAWSIEYRRSLLDYVDWTITYLDEGEEHTLRREGIFSQLWLVRNFFSRHLQMGIGGGLYAAMDRSRDPTSHRQGDEFFSGIVSMTAGYLFHPHWGTRLTWSRIVTDYDRDTDVILGGIGYRF